MGSQGHKRGSLASLLPVAQPRQQVLSGCSMCRTHIPTKLFTSDTACRNSSPAFHAHPPAEVPGWLAGSYCAPGGT